MTAVHGDTPLFSIAIPTFNRQDLVVSAIDSALGQSYSNLEVFVSDNASPDSTERAVTSITDPRLRYSRNATNIGPGENWIKCIHHVRGQYCSWLQDDDLLFPDFVADAVRVLEETRAACCVAACIYTSTPASLQHASVFTTAMPLDWLTGTVTRLPFSLALPLAIFESSGIPPAMAFRTEGLRPHVRELCTTEFPLYAERLPLVHFAQHGGLVVIPKIYGIYRAHSAQFSRTLLSKARNASKQFHAFLAVLQRMADQYQVSLDDFQSFLRDAPDAVVMRFSRIIDTAPHVFPLVTSVSELLEEEIRRRPLNSPAERARRFLARWTPAALRHLVA